MPFVYSLFAVSISLVPICELFKGFLIIREQKVEFLIEGDANIAMLFLRGRESVEKI